MVSPHSAMEYRHLLNYAVKYCSMAIKYNEGPWKDASPFLRKRALFGTLPVARNFHFLPLQCEVT